MACSCYVPGMSEVATIVVPGLQKIQTQLMRLAEDVANLREDVRHIKTRLAEPADGSFR